MANPGIISNLTFQDTVAWVMPAIYLLITRLTIQRDIQENFDKRLEVIVCVSVRFVSDGFASEWDRTAVAATRRKKIREEEAQRSVSGGAC